MCVWYLPKEALLAQVQAGSEGDLSEKRGIGAVLRRVEAALLLVVEPEEGEAGAAAGEAFTHRMVITGEEPCRSILLSIHTRGLSGAAELDLQLSREEVEVRHEKVGSRVAPLKVLLPFDIDEDHVVARFDRATEELALELVEAEPFTRC